MFPQLRALLSFIVAEGVRRPETVTLEAWGRQRVFAAYDFGEDTFVFEDGIWDRLDNKDPFIFVPKADLLAVPEDGSAPRVYGNVMAISSGNHAVASMPLLSGKFWDLAQVPEHRRGDLLRQAIVCGNCVADTFEISQREVPTERVLEMDNWLQGIGCPMQRIVLIDRVDQTLNEYRCKGQEWRIKQLAWTNEEMVAAIRGAQSRIHSGVRYYHNVKGVHFLTYTHFLALGEQLRTKPEAFLRGLAELAVPSPDDGVSFLRRPRYGHHHEVELFGLLPGVAEQQLVPAIEALQAEVATLSPDALMQRFAGIADAFRKKLLCAQMADEQNPFFIETLYHHITGEVYLGVPGSITPAFDDRRTALPGATYLYDNRYIHPGTDGRTEAILSYLESNVSHGDRIEYVNVYEIRSESDTVRLGEGKTREIVYKTTWQPLPIRLIEKRLAQKSTGYGTYTMARVQAFRALGISYGPHRLLARTDGVSGDVHFFVRERYPGEGFNALPAASFQSRDARTGEHDTTGEDPDIVRSIILLMGEAAAENVVLKKLTPDSDTNRYGEGKEIIEFGYDIRHGKEMPVKVWLCSIRGTMGWPDFECSDRNLHEAMERYLDAFARVVVAYARQHPCVTRDDLVTAFMEGFGAKTRELCWNYTSRREQFDSYNPMLFGDYHFAPRWKFVLWSLVQQRQRLDELGVLFRQRVEARVAAEAPPA
jgi:hypothetical protein